MPGSKDGGKSSGGGDGKHSRPSDSDGNNPKSTGKFGKPADPGGKHSGGKR
jgi:hypothetical protein